MQKTGKYYWLTIIAYMMAALTVVPIVLCTGLVVNSMNGVAAALVFAGLGNGGEFFRFSIQTCPVCGFWSGVFQSDGVFPRC